MLFPDRRHNFEIDITVRITGKFEAPAKKISG